MAKATVKSRAANAQKGFSGSYGRFTKAVALLSVGVFAAAALWQYFSAPHPLPAAARNASMDAVYKDNKWVALPNHDQFVAVAKIHGWSPVTPTERLEATLSRYPQVFDAMTDQESDPTPYIKYLDDEVRFLLQVLQQSPGHAYDLSELLHSALHAVHQLRFRVMKHRLLLGEPRVINRDVVDTWTRHWILNPVKAILSVDVQKYPHISLDLEFAPAASGFTALMKAVQFRLYGALAALALRSPNPKLERALHVALSNGDDVATGILVKIQLDYGLPPEAPFLSPRALLGAAAAATDAHYLHLAKRVATGLCVYANRHRAGNLTLDSLAEVEAGIRGTGVVCGEELALHNEYAPVAPEERASAAGTFMRPVCDIAHVQLDQWDAQAFHAFVRRNVPVLIDLPREGALGSDAFDRDALLRRLAATKVLVGPIPYASLFGKQERWWTLGEYLAYSTNFSTALPADLATALGVVRKPPLYLFSDEQMEINALLRPEAFKVLAQPHLSESSSTPVSLLHLLHTVTQATPSRRDASAAELQSELRTIMQLYVGPALSGAPMHSHGPAMNVLLQGSKLWTLAPPARELYTNVHPQEWIAADLVHSKENPLRGVDSQLPDAEPCYLVQRAGQVLYAPRHWTHQVLNMDEAIGFAVEVKNYVY